MALTQAMRDLFAKLTTTEDSTGERFGSTGAWIHVGSSTGAFTSTQTYLLSTGAKSTSMDATFPTRAANVLTYRATFDTGTANFPWEEWAVRNSSSTSAGTGFQRALQTLGTKTAAQTWQFTATITVTT